MKNSSSYLGLNKKSLENKLREVYNIQNMSRVSVEFPKINLLSENQPCSDQKTLTKLIQKLEKYVMRSQRKVPQILHECLATLKVQLNEAIRKHNKDIRQILKADVLQKQNSKSNAYLSKSHVVNFSRNMKKIESRQLCDKVNSAKLQKNGILTKKNEKEVIDNLKAKIEQKDIIINSLKKEIQEVKMKLCNQQLLVEAQKNSNQKLLYQKQKLFKDLSIQCITTKTLNQTIQKLNSEVKLLNEGKEQFEKNCNILKQKLQEREEEIKSIWLLKLKNNEKQ